MSFPLRVFVYSDFCRNFYLFRIDLGKFIFSDSSRRSAIIALSARHFHSNRICCLGFSPATHVNFFHGIKYWRHRVPFVQANDKRERRRMHVGVDCSINNSSQEQCYHATQQFFHFSCSWAILSLPFHFYLLSWGAFLCSIIELSHLTEVFISV